MTIASAQHILEVTVSKQHERRAEITRKFIVHSIDLPLKGISLAEWRYKELRKSLESAVQCVWFAVKMIICELLFR